jgi:adenine-specific DNA-methyltransferase
MNNPEKPAGELRLEMKTPSLADANFAALAALFPNAVTETIDENGTVVRAIDKDVLTQEINAHVVEGREERYQFTWPDKRKSVLLANAPIAAALRPCREESVDFDNTENLYIEGDNLDVLKLLRETYLNRVKMIYIDPPYNTGNDFVYEDDFAEDAGEFLSRDGQYDEDGNRMVKNLDSNGRFHTDWLNMMYPRLRVARDLLTEDGVIFISIDDNEVENLKKICNEVFGEVNFIACLPTIMNLKGNNDEFGFAGTHEYTIVFSKSISDIENLYGINLTEGDKKEYSEKDNKGFYKKGATLMRTGEAGAKEKRPKGYYPIYVSADKSRMSLTKLKDTDIEVYPKTKTGKNMSWRRSIDTLQQSLSEFIICDTLNGISFYKKQRLEEDMITGRKPKSLFYKPQYSSGNGTEEMKSLFGDRVFDNPKPLELIKDFIQVGTRNDDLILDFFSGSATTAHAVMQLNAEDGGKRKFIMVQLPEVCAEGSEAAKAGYANICEIGKERIRRAGQKIKTEAGLTAQGLDTGFRVLKLDSTNMKDVYYTPDEYAQMNFSFDGLADNIKEDRTPEDLLFQVMLDLGIPLSAKITQDGDVYYINDNYLVACFKQVDTELITEIAKQKPYYAVFRDSSFTSDSAMVNFEQVFRTYSPNTIRRVL